MREKYESLGLTILRELAKARGMKGISALKKEELIEAMLKQDELDKLAVSEDERITVEKKDSPVSTSVQKTVKTGNRVIVKTVSGKKTATDKNRGIAISPEEEDSIPLPETRNPINNAIGHRREVIKDSFQAGDEIQNIGSEKPVADAESTVNTVERQYTASERPNITTEKQNVISERPNITTEKQNAVSERPNISTEKQNNVSEKSNITVEKQYIGTEKPNQELDSGQMATGILEVMSDGFGFIRSDNFLPGDNDVYVAPSQIRRFGLKTGDIIEGNMKVKSPTEKFGALLFVRKVNGYPPQPASARNNFEDMTPIFPNQRIKLELPGASVALRIMDLLSPVGKGQRGMIVSPPKAGKTTLLKEVALSVKATHPNMHMIILLIDERPEEVTDIREAIEGPGAEVIYSTFDETPEHHKRVSEMVIERAKRLVEQQKDVIILLDSITRLTRAYNQVVPVSGRTLSGGLDPAALHMPKRFFGAARNMREGGSLTILATALVDTGSKMDDVVYEEFKGTGNMEIILDRKLSERRLFPAIDIAKSGTRRDDLLLDSEEMEAVSNMRKALNGLKADEAVEAILSMFSRARSNREVVQLAKKYNFNYK